MERTISVEEKIRRAEEIYERRKQENQAGSRQIATVNVREKKDIKLLKKMLIQILVCVCIYLLIYALQNSDYVFSKDFINKINELITYDTNFVQIYENLKGWINNLNTPETNVESVTEQSGGIGGASEENESQDSNQENLEDKNLENTNSGNNNQENVITDNLENTNAEQNLSQAEQDVMNIKNTTTFIKPVDGVVSSKYGQRDTATGNVPKNHTGIDIAANLGTRIKSATDGEVVLSSEEGDYGKHIKIQIGEVSIIYAHCNNLYVKQGDKVVQGQEIAEVGSTGNSTRTTFTF